MDDRPANFRNFVYSFAFVPIVETTIEEKHSRLSLLKSGPSGPCFASLCNRMPLLERVLLRQPDLLADLLEAFSKSRVISHIPYMLGLDGHPMVQALSRTVWKQVVACHAVIYRCDVDTLLST